MNFEMFIKVNIMILDKSYLNYRIYNILYKFIAAISNINKKWIFLKKSNFTIKLWEFVENYLTRIYDLNRNVRCEDAA